MQWEVSAAATRMRKLLNMKVLVEWYAEEKKKKRPGLSY